METVTLKEYYQMLDKHDWYFDWSDDGRVWEKGRANNSRLAAISTQSPKHKELWEGFKKHKFTGKPWNTEQAPKPEEPKE